MNERSVKCAVNFAGMNETMSGIKDVQMLNIASIVDVYAAAAFERKEYTGVE